MLCVGRYEIVTMEAKDFITRMSPRNVGKW
jgi:hypothetical protein